MLAVVPQITTSRLDGPAIPITPVTAPPQTTNAQPPAADSNSTNTATSPSTSAAPSPSKTKPNSKSGATAGAGTASTAAPLTAVGSQDSVLGSWSTLSIPKSAGTATKAATSRKSKSNSSPLLNKDDGPSNSVSVPPTATTGTFLAPKSRSKSRPNANNRLHSNSTPTAPRTLVPEPAPPPPSALNNKPLKPPQRLSSSSKDRRQPRKHASAERRQSTPYPLSAVTRRNRVSSGPIMGMYPSETGGSEGVRPSGIVRRPSPVPPSSSHSDSSRSSDSYVSLKDDGSARKSTAGPPPSGPLPSRPPLPQAPSNQQVIPGLTPKPSFHLLAALRSQAQSPLRLPPPTPGLPRIFHPSPLNPNAPPSPYNPYQPIPRFSPLLSRHPGRHAHIVPLPSLTYPSAQQRPRALPPSEIDGQVWTSTQTGMEEYASDHPHDLVQRAIEMEARDELERVRVWCHDVFRVFLPPKDEERNAGEDNASAGGDAFFLLEKPPKIDLESLTPHRSQDSASGEIPVLVPYTMTDEERAAKDRALPKVPTVAVAAATPDSLVPFPTVEAARMASPYPAPPENHVVHLDSSSASSQMAVEVPVTAGLTPDPSHLAPPLTTQKSFVSLTTPSPFGLPSPLRLPMMQTPMTPFYPLGSANAGELPTPPAQEPLPPILEPEDQQKQTPDVIPVDAVQRVPSALERVSSYLGSTASPRPPSPETPPRIIHSSNSHRADEEEEQPPVVVPSRTRTRSRSTDSIPSNPWRRVRSADSSSTISRAFTKTSRGRSPTRRSWKAASERAAATSSHGIISAARIGVGMVMQRIDGTERITVMQPVLISRPPTGVGAAVAALQQRGAGSGYSWPDNLSSVGDENDRPRTASRSSRSRYSSPPEDPAHAVVEGQQRPETQLSVLTADLFYKAQPTPVEEKPAQSVAVAQVVEQPKSTTPETLKPAESRKEAQMMLVLPPVNRPSAVSPSVLRRRKSHRARQSVVSLPASGDERDASREVEDPSGKTKPEKPPVVKVQVPTFADVLPPALRTSFPSATSNHFVSPATSKAVQPLLPLVRPAFHSPSVSSPASATASAPVHSLLFNKLVVLIAQFNSDLSLGRNKVPRWKRDFAEMDDKVRMVYDAFANAVERSRVEFRPWLRDHHHPGAADEEEEGKNVMYVDDLWEKIASEVSARGNLSAHAVQEDIIRSVTSSWEFLASECLNSVREVLSQLVTSIVDLHFRCAGDGNQLRAIVQSVADDQLHAQVEMTGRKLAEFGALEARTVFTSSHARLRDSAAAILSHFKDLRHQADHTILEQGPLRQSPVPLARAEAVKAKPLDHVVPVAGPSHSRESHTMSVPSSFTGQTLFSKGVPLSTVATSEDQGRQSDAVGGLRRRLAEQQRQRADSLRQANDAIQAALSSLRSVGFHDLSSPEQLLEKLVEPDPVDEVLEIMANVVAYLDLASIRFVDYITLHIEDYLVNAIGEKINAAVVANLDLSGANIEERCLRWMAA